MLRLRYFLEAVIIIPLFLLLVPLAWAADPNGASTLASDPNLAVNFTWVLMAAFLVFLMQGGFAMLESGLTRAKNAGNILMKNLVDFSAGSIAYWLVGFAIMFGTSASFIIGTDGFLLLGEAYDVDNYKLWMFQAVFAATAATIVSGAMAERTKFKAYIVYTVVITALIYPVYGHWVWGGGWLSQLGDWYGLGLGHLDFAGSGVVHMVGGMSALAGAMVVGPRIGKYASNGKPLAIPGHNLPIAILGVFLLWFGWFGFNAGSTLAATELRIAVIAVNTNLAAAAGALVAVAITWKKYGKSDVSMAGNGALAGLVAITAPCAWVESWAAVVIGLIAGIIVVKGVEIIDNRGIDDPVGAIAVHGLSGAWGLASVGIFADGTYGNYTTDAPYVIGVLYGGGFGQLLAQLIGIGANFIWVFGVAYVTFRIIKSTMGLRVSKEVELRGLDISEHGVVAYPDFMAIEEKEVPLEKSKGKVAKEAKKK